MTISRLLRHDWNILKNCTAMHSVHVLQSGIFSSSADVHRPRSVRLCTGFFKLTKWGAGLFIGHSVQSMKNAISNRVFVKRPRLFGENEAGNQLVALTLCAVRHVAHVTLQPDARNTFCIRCNTLHSCCTHYKTLLMLLHVALMLCMCSHLAQNFETSVCSTSINSEGKLIISGTICI